jgi:hypothetical protein
LAAAAAVISTARADKKAAIFGGVMDIKDPAHQAREHPLTPYEDSLADALENILGENRHALAEIVAALNERNLAPPGGGTWTEASFTEEMQRLGR